MTWINTTDDDEMYPHILYAATNEETANVLVIERVQEPWYRDGEEKYNVLKTPDTNSSKVLDEIAEELDTLEEAVEAAEEFTGAEIPLPDDGD